MSTVKLESYSRPHDEEMGDCNLLDLIAYYARVSNPSSQAQNQNSERLIKYLIRHKHWSPFEMVNITLEINTTRDISHQIIRHRSFSFQEFSQRYADPTKSLFNFETREARLQDTKNRQNSFHTDNDELKASWEAKQRQIFHEAALAYRWAVSEENGIAKEQARAVLPEGMTPSRLYMNGSVRSWIHYIDLRTTPGTQLEHMVVARQCADAIAPVFPLITEFVHDEDNQEEYNNNDGSRDHNNLGGQHVFQSGNLEGSRKEGVLRKLLRRVRP